MAKNNLIVSYRLTTVQLIRANNFDLKNRYYFTTKFQTNPVLLSSILLDMLGQKNVLFLSALLNKAQTHMAIASRIGRESEGASSFLCVSFFP
jgi:hypothetical protein